MPKYRTNKKALDALVKQQRMIDRHERFVSREVQKILTKMKREVVRDLMSSPIGETKRADWQRARLNGFLESANERISEHYRLIDDYTHDQLKGLVEVSTDGLVTAFNSAMKKGYHLTPVQWTDEALNRIAGDTLVNGSTASDWWKRQSTGFQNSVGDQLRMGMLRGESVPEMAARISPTIEKILDAQKDGNAMRDIFGTAQRNAEALVRTSTLTIMREANTDVFAANADIIAGVQWCATLDDRTTDMCQALDGLMWSIPDYEPMGHDKPFPGMSPHWNCRSVVLPVTKDWEELAKENGGDTEWARGMDTLQQTGAERASAEGQVDSAMTYLEWAKATGRKQ